MIRPLVLLSFVCVGAVLSLGGSGVGAVRQDTQATALKSIRQAGQQQHRHYHPKPIADSIASLPSSSPSSAPAFLEEDELAMLNALMEVKEAARRRAGGETPAKKPPVALAETDATVHVETTATRTIGGVPVDDLDTVAEAAVQRALRTVGYDEPIEDEEPLEMMGVRERGYGVDQDVPRFVEERSHASQPPRPRHLSREAGKEAPRDGSDKSDPARRPPQVQHSGVSDSTVLSFLETQLEIDHNREEKSPKRRRKEYERMARAIREKRELDRSVRKTVISSDPVPSALAEEKVRTYPSAVRRLPATYRAEIPPEDDGTAERHLKGVKQPTSQELFDFFKGFLPDVKRFPPSLEKHYADARFVETRASQRAKAHAGLGVGEGEGGAGGFQYKPSPFKHPPPPPVPPPPPPPPPPNFGPGSAYSLYRFEERGEGAGHAEGEPGPAFASFWSRAYPHDPAQYETPETMRFKQASPFSTYQRLFNEQPLPPAKQDAHASSPSAPAPAPAATSFAEVWSSSSPELAKAHQELQDFVAAGSDTERD